MHITFYMNDEDKKLFEFDLVEYKEIQNILVHNQVLASMVLRKAHQTTDLCAEGLKSYFRYALGGVVELEDYIDHIKEYGFYTPYERNVRVKVEE